MSTHRIFVKNHFGYSKEDDEVVTSSDNVRISYYENTDPVYHYEKTDKAAALKGIITHYNNLKKRLETEKNPVKVEHIKKILKMDRFSLTRNKDYIEKYMKLNFAQIMSENSL